MKIGNLDLGPRPVLLAPMEDVTDVSFRILCREQGADMVYTEFIPSDGLIRDASKALAKMKTLEEEAPVGIQIYGHIPESMVEAAKMAERAAELVGGHGADVIDINFGCPVTKIAGRGAGSGMMRYPDKMVAITKAVVEAVDKPVTVKTRLGWDDSSKIIVELAERLQDVGIQALTIHGRTRCQMYKGSADWTLIGEVKNNPRMHIPIIGNGDICTPQQARDAFDRYGVDGIMIGRATFGHPWLLTNEGKMSKTKGNVIYVDDMINIFGLDAVRYFVLHEMPYENDGTITWELKHFLETGEELQPLSVREKVDLAKRQLALSLQYKGEPRGIFEMRRHLSCYFKGLPDFKETRMKMVTTLDVAELYAILDTIAERWDFI